MNDKIKQLAVQSGMSKLVDSWEYERFAELIVRECLLKIEDERYELPDFIVDSVKQHFGVEE